MAYDVMLSQTPQALRTPVVWRLPGCGGGKTALFCGAAQTLGAELQALGARHIFLVIGRHAARTDTKAVILNSLRASGITWDVYSEIPAEPHLEDALQMAEAMKGARYDAVVGVGGGSVLDLRSWRRTMWMERSARASGQRFFRGLAFLWCCFRPRPAQEAR